MLQTITFSCTAVTSTVCEGITILGSSATKQSVSDTTFVFRTSGVFGCRWNIKKNGVYFVEPKKKCFNKLHLHNQLHIIISFLSSSNHLLWGVDGMHHILQFFVPVILHVIAVLWQWPLYSLISPLILSIWLRVVGWRDTLLHTQFLEYVLI